MVLKEQKIKSAVELTSTRPPGDWLISPFRRFAGLSAASGVVLVACALIAMLWSNFAPAAYQDILHANLAIQIGPFELSRGLLHWIEDTLMAVFFLLVGLEIKRELLTGELSSVRKASLPIFAALGGMLVPAGIYIAVVALSTTIAGGTIEPEAAAWRGWGVPMATDIAFALGVMALLGRRVPLALRVFLSALAIADDLGALIVIAIFYTESLNASAMGWAAMVYLFLIFCALIRVREPLIYTLLGIVLLYFMSETGVHATITGVLVASVIPVSARVDVASYLRSTRKALDVIEEDQRIEGRLTPELTPTQMVATRIIALNSRHIQPPLHRIEHALGPWVAFLVLPIFALSNAGVDLSGVRFSAETIPVGLGVFCGLVIGKPLGIVAASWIAVRLGLAALPTGVGWDRMWGVGLLAGIGFTMAVFITGLAFPAFPETGDVAKLAVLGASVIASVAGLLLLLRCSRASERSERDKSITMEESLESLEERLEQQAHESGDARGPSPRTASTGEPDHQLDGP